MKLMLNRFYEFLARPLFGPARVVLVLLVIPLAIAFTQPLWRISMNAPQYPNGLYMDIYPYKLVGGNDGQDIHEINTLNHYIGMRKLDAAAAADLDWIPFALGGLVLLGLRCAVVGTVRDLIDLVVVTTYVSAFAFSRFVYRLWIFGHDLDPHAPVKVKPFLPVIFGHKTVANFETYSYPQLGSYLLGVFATGITVVVLWHLIVGRRRAVRAASAAGAAIVALAAAALAIGWSGTARAEPGRTSLEASTSVPAEQDACLDHTVKELGMSAKRKDPAVRAWTIGPQFIHPSLQPDGTVQVALNRGVDRSAIVVTLTWSGPLKEAAVQSEIEQRAAAMATKMAQLCGALKAPLRCVTSTGSGAPASCRHAP